jgi:site-specific DNA recombinase
VERGYLARDTHQPRLRRTDLCRPCALPASEDPPLRHPPHRTPSRLGRPAFSSEEWIPVATVEAVVSQEQFDLAGEKLSKNKSFARRNNKAHDYLLRALVSCGRCKLCSVARTQHAKNKYKQRYYVCSGKYKQAQSGLKEKCPSRHVPADQLDELVWKDLCEVMTHPQGITDALERAHGGRWLPQELKARQKNLREGRAALKRQLERLTDAYLGEVIPLSEYERRRGDLQQRDGALAGQQRQLETQADQRMELAGVAGSVGEFCERVRSGLANATFEQRRELVKLLVDRIIVTDEEVEIRYVIPTSSESEHIRFCHLRLDYLHHPSTRQSNVPSRRHEPLPIDLLALLGPFLGPSLRHLLRDGLRGLAHDLHAQAQNLLSPAFAPSLVAGVHPQVLQAREPAPRRLQ